MFNSCSGYILSFSFRTFIHISWFCCYSLTGTITFPAVVLPWSCTIKQQYCKKNYLAYSTNLPAELNILFECKSIGILNIQFCSVEMLLRYLCSFMFGFKLLIYFCMWPLEEMSSWIWVLTFWRLELHHKSVDFKTGCKKC